MTTDARTLAWYDREAADYAQATFDHGARDSLKAFEARLPRGARVLDLGCGGGHDAAWLVAQGHSVDAMDASGGLAQEAQARWGIVVRVAPFEALDAVAVYDGIWSAAALHHASRAALPGLLDRVGAALKPRGVFSATMKGGPERRDGFGRYFADLDAQYLERLLADANIWSEAVVRETRGAGHDGVETPWFIVSARRSPT